MKKIYFLICSFLFLQNVFSQTVIVGTGTGISAFSPFDRHYEYNVYEVIYPASEILIAGTINRLAFERVDGTEVNPIDSVTIYMQHTPQSALTAGTFSTSGYTLVYEGSFPNDSGSGWREVTLTYPFPYDGISNLQVMAVKGFQPAVANTPVSPRWYYSPQSTSIARRYYGSAPVSTGTSLTTTTYRSNIKLDISSVGEIEISSRIPQLFPNPATDWIEVEDPLLDGRLTILNSIGEAVFSSVFNEKIRIDLSRFSNGIYHLMLLDGTGKKVIAETFIKN